MLIIYSHRFSIIFETKMTLRDFDKILEVIAPPYNVKCLKRQLEYDENIQKAVSYSIIKTINVRLLMQYFCFHLLVYSLWEVLMHFKRFVKLATFSIYF